MAAVAAGRSVLIGVEARGVLAYCVEVAPDGSVRQFLGERNRTVPRPVVAPVCDFLVVAGVVDPARTGERGVAGGLRPAASRPPAQAAGVGFRGTTAPTRRVSPSPNSSTVTTLCERSG